MFHNQTRLKVEQLSCLIVDQMHTNAIFDINEKLKVMMSFKHIYVTDKLRL